MSEQKLASSPADEWRIMVCPLGSNTPVRWVRESFYMRELSAATARADALLLALEAARHEAICAAASGRVRLEIIDKVLNEARKGATVPQWMATRADTANMKAEG